MYFHDPAGRQTKEIFPGATIRTFWGEEMLLGVADLAPNSVVPPHRHPQEQGGIVLEGEIEFCIGGETKLLRRGEIYVIPADVEHSARTGQDPVQVLDIFSPVRADWKY
jgi:quercetin dioxygenase-like cupin family protein